MKELVQQIKKSVQELNRLISEAKANGIDVELTNNNHQGLIEQERKVSVRVFRVIEL